MMTCCLAVAFVSDWTRDTLCAVLISRCLPRGQGNLGWWSRFGLRSAEHEVTSPH